MSKVNPKIDLVFKKLFGTEENKDILLSLINAILPDYQQIATLDIKNPYNVSDYAEGKLSILDIRAEDERGIQYDIEMQIKGTNFYGKRTLYYWAKMFGSQLDYLPEEAVEKKKKRNYSDLSKCIVISLMDFNFFSDEQYHRCYMLKDRETDEIHPDLDYLDLYFIELDKCDVDVKHLQTSLEKWILFLNNAYRYSNNTLPKELADIKAIKKASAKLDIMYLDEKERQYYESQQKFMLDENTRIQAAVEEATKAAEEAAKIAIAAAEEVAQTAEAQKKAAEEATKTAETQKKIAEEATKIAEEATKIAETQKKAAQEATKAAEEAAKSAEEKTQNQQIEFVKNAIAQGFDDKIIAKLTGLTIAQVKKLRN
jgi:predicted transposase/invertase (TIGR01784 family)